ncbi:MAG: hypothetical protein CL761_03435 [Chloroflexi bacterium]|jgi:DNA-directed RNA polymerase beta' subunit|nr:hypothetical protein [Chloroflexota bacterium]|tara:strand:+ start:5842 stop:6186 length:345 start_codon:yes stop_codon:yes gene_type:complete
MRSHLEEQVADLLDQLAVPYQYESEKLPYLIEANYIPDFKVGDIYLEAKGYFPPEQRRKMKAVKESHPDLDIRIIFQSPNNKISKRSKTTYAKWAEKNGFPWCAYYAIPVDWLR